MRNFLIGLGGMLAGAALVIAACIGTVFQDVYTGSISPFWRVAIVLGALVMVGSPVVLWIILPIRNRLRKRGPPGARCSWGTLLGHIIVAVCTVWWTLGFGNLIYALVAHYWPKRALT